MSIANELCSDVASAVLARREKDDELASTEMTKILLEVHTTLRRLTAERRRRLFLQEPATPPAGNAAAGGGH
jgi:hypothetical protein